MQQQSINHPRQGAAGQSGKHPRPEAQESQKRDQGDEQGGQVEGWQGGNQQAQAESPYLVELPEESVEGEPEARLRMTPTTTAVTAVRAALSERLCSSRSM